MSDSLSLLGLKFTNVVQPQLDISIIFALFGGIFAIYQYIKKNEQLENERENKRLAVEKDNKELQNFEYNLRELSLNLIFPLLKKFDLSYSILNDCIENIKLSPEATKPFRPYLDFQNKEIIPIFELIEYKLVLLKYSHLYRKIRDYKSTHALFLTHQFKETKNLNFFYSANDIGLLIIYEFMLANGEKSDADLLILDRTGGRSAEDMQKEIFKLKNEIAEYSKNRKEVNP